MIWKKYLIPKKFTGFTLAEILISVAIIAILATIFLTTNLTNSLKSTRDAKRKQDFAKLTRVLEEYYNDNGSYPRADSGNISGFPWGSYFTPNVPQLPKDPLSPQRDYYYLSGQSMQNYYALFAKLENTGDSDIAESGCGSGCGPSKAYNYVVHSPNVYVANGITSGDALLGEGAGGEGEGGGGGGGGTPQPTDTGVPATIPPSGPTPTPSTAPGGTCDFDQCCKNRWCGGGSGIGVFCMTGERCWYDPMWGWMCYAEPLCP
jgi:prepilin-type N-terminal cleavage/methylation domain-containing protein